MHNPRIVLLLLAALPACSDSGAEPDLPPPTTVASCSSCKPGDVRGGLFFAAPSSDALLGLDPYGLQSLRDVESLAGGDEQATSFLEGLEGALGVRAVSAPDLTGRVHENVLAAVPKGDGGSFLLVASDDGAAEDPHRFVSLVSTDNRGRPLVASHYDRIDGGGELESSLHPDGRGGAIMYANHTLEGKGGELVVSVGPNGFPRFTRTMTTPVHGIGVTGDGAIIVATLASGTVPSIVLSAVDLDGASRWERTLQLTGYDGVNGLSLDHASVASDGRIFLSGSIGGGRLIIPGGAIEPLHGEGDKPVSTRFIAELGPDGTLRWAHRGVGDLRIDSLVPTPTGVIAAGTFSAGLDHEVSIGNLTIGASNAEDGIALELDDKGVRWYSTFEGPGLQRVDGAAVSSSGARYALVTSHGSNPTAVTVNDARLEGDGRLLVEIAR